MSDFAVQEKLILDGRAKLACTNRIIQIGYDYIKSGGKNKELSDDLDKELEKQGLSEKRDWILSEIATGFNLNEGCPQASQV